METIKTLVCNILEAFQNGAFAQVAFCDWSKDIHCVSHSDLLYTFYFYGRPIHRLTLKVFENYLTNHKQVVHINAGRSDEVNIYNGLTQVLGDHLYF